MIDRRLIHAISTARYGSFTAAANRIGVTQSAITKSIADLELELGYSIFNRTARGALLTDEGRSFIDRAAHLVEETEDLLHGKTGDIDQFSGVLRIGVCPASLAWILEEPLSRLINRHPGIRLHMVSGNYDLILQQLRAGAVDVALGYEASLYDQPDLMREPLPPLESVFFVRRDHPILSCAKITKTEFSRYDLILPSVPFFYSLIWSRINDDAELDMRDRLHIIDFFPIVSRLVREGDYISVTSVRRLGEPSFTRHFVPLSFAGPLQPSPISCAVRARTGLRPAVQSFIECCKAGLVTPQASG